ncbi:MAG: DUF4870 domain-containing protein [Dehalococcoidia bacterium]
MTEQDKPQEEGREPEVPATPPPSGNSEISPQEMETRRWAALLHASALAGYFIPIPFGTVVLPLILWLVKKNDLPALDEHGKAAVNFQITMAIAAIVSVILMFVLIGFLLLPAVAIYALVEIILNAIRASNGESPNYRISLRLL